MSTLTMKQIENTVTATGLKFQNYYLDYLNDFLTIGGYARYYNITETDANKRINIGRKIHEAKTGGR